MAPPLALRPAQTRHLVGARPPELLRDQFGVKSESEPEAALQRDDAGTRAA